MNTLKRYMKVAALSVLITALCLALLAIFAGFTLNRIIVYLDTYEFQDKIKNEQVSFVVQGPIRGTKDSRYKGSTQACLKSIRRHFPGSPVILSTWEGSDVTGLAYDKLVLNKEPQGFLYTNIKQHISTLEGLKLVSTEYALKIRTDAYLAHRGFINYYAKYGIKSGGKHNVFDGNKIMICDRCKPAEASPLLELCDFYHFGRTEDLLSLFAKTPLITKAQEKHSNDCCKFSKTTPCSLDDCYKAQFSPEQWYFLASFRKAFPKDKIENYYFYSPNIYLDVNRFIADNIIVLGDIRSGIYLPKYANRRWTFVYKEWIALVNKFGSTETSLPKVRSTFYEAILSYTGTNRILVVLRREVARLLKQVDYWLV